MIIIIVVAFILNERMFPDYAENRDLVLSIDLEKQKYKFNEQILLTIQIQNVNLFKSVKIHEIGVEYGTLIISITYHVNDTNIDLESVYLIPMRSYREDYIKANDEILKPNTISKIDVDLYFIELHLDEKYYCKFVHFLKDFKQDNNSDHSGLLNDQNPGEYKISASYRHSGTEPIIAESNSKSIKIIQ